MLRRIYFAYLFSVLLPLDRGTTFAATFTVTGRLRYNVLVPAENGARPHQEWRYTVAVSNCIWAIEMIPAPDPNRPTAFIPTLGGGPPRLDQYAEFAACRQIFSGTTLVSLIHWKKTARDGRDGVISVEKSELPQVDSPGFAQAVWLAYASSCYLNNARTTGRLKPVWYVNRRLRTGGFTASAKWEQRSDGVPSAVDYYWDEAEWNEWMSGHKPTPSKHPTLYLCERYRASGFTNVNGLELPISFSLTAFEPLREISTGEKLPGSEITATTYSVSLALDSTLFDPRFKGVAVVEDLRFAHGQETAGIGYMLTNSAPPAMDDPVLALMAQRQAFIDRISAQHAPLDNKRAPLTFLLLAVIISGAFIVILVKRQQTKRENSL